jgi:hypothetical protein
MSRSLPARPNLEFLKNEAKDLLDALRRTDSEAQLSNAQFALSRDYGFASWPALKAHVESLAVPESLIAGGWIANLALSKRHPANLFRSARIHFAVRGNVVEIVDEYIDEHGKATRGRNRIDVDGAAHETGNGYAVTATWLGASGFQTVATRHGESIGGATYTVSANGRTLTITDASGDSVIVLDRLIQ